MNPSVAIVIAAAIAAAGSIFTSAMAIMNHSKVTKLEVSINGRIGELLKLTAKASHAEGVLDEKTNPSP